MLGRGELLLGESGRLAQFFDHLDDGDDLFVGEQDRLEHLLFGHFAGKALDHGDRLAGAGDDQVEIAFLQLPNAWASRPVRRLIRPTRTEPVG